MKKIILILSLLCVIFMSLYFVNFEKLNNGKNHIANSIFNEIILINQDGEYIEADNVYSDDALDRIESSLKKIKELNGMYTSLGETKPLFMETLCDDYLVVIQKITNGDKSEEVLNLQKEVHNLLMLYFDDSLYNYDKTKKQLFEKDNEIKNSSYEKYIELHNKILKKQG